MAERAAFWMLLAAGMFMSGLGEYMAGPTLVVPSLIYYHNFVKGESND